MKCPSACTPVVPGDMTRSPDLFLLISERGVDRNIGPCGYFRLTGSCIGIQTPPSENSRD
jgi:hypothetical protein